jgi:hypothetical protein
VRDLRKPVNKILALYNGGVGDNAVTQRDVDDSDRAEVMIRAALRIFMSTNYSDIFKD